MLVTLQKMTNFSIVGSINSVFFVGFPVFCCMPFATALPYGTAHKGFGARTFCLFISVFGWSQTVHSCTF